MTQIRGFIAASLDGYIAREDGGIEWLDEFGKTDYGYDAFIAQIETVVIGRRTYDQIQDSFDWPYHGKHAVILSHRPVDQLPEKVEVWGGDVTELVERLRRTASGDVWVVGGSVVQQQFLDIGGLDRIEVFVIPLLLGRGIPLWLPTTRRHRLTLNSATPLLEGMVRLDYQIHAERGGTS